jgi:hypothetical protein
VGRVSRGRRPNDHRHAHHAHNPTNMITSHHHPPPSLRQRLIRRSLLILAAGCLIAASLAAQATETDLAADLSTHPPAHTGTCTQRCPLGHRPHHNLVTGWPQPLLPLALLALSATSLVGATRIQQRTSPADPAVLHRSISDRHTDNQPSPRAHRPLTPHIHTHPHKESP